MATRVVEHLTVVVTGSRRWRNARAVWSELNKIRLECRQLTLVQGGASGIDHHVRQWAKAAINAGEPVKSITVIAEWAKYGNAAGPIRNRLMLAKYTPDFLLAFPGGRGTQSCIDRAVELGIPIRVIPDQGGMR